VESVTPLSAAQLSPPPEGFTIHCSATKLDKKDGPLSKSGTWSLFMGFLYVSLVFIVEKMKRKKEGKTKEKGEKGKKKRIESTIPVGNLLNFF